MGNACMDLNIICDCVAGFEPLYASEGAAGADLKAYIDSDLVLEPGTRTLVSTGVRLAIPSGYEGQVRPRSGLAHRFGVTLANAPGTIDSDYRGEVSVILINLGAEPFVVKRGDRIAQLIIVPVTRASFLSGTLPETRRGIGGFGSTGVQSQS